LFEGEIPPGGKGGGQDAPNRFARRNLTREKKRERGSGGSRSLLASTGIKKSSVSEEGAYPKKGEQEHWW